MKSLTRLITASLVLMAFNSWSMGEDDPFVNKITIDQFETRNADGSNPTILEADAWFGYDFNKLWLKFDIEKVGSELEEAEIQLLYSRAVDPYWDFQIGLRHDNKPKPSENWLVLGFEGLAPYWIETDAALFITDDSQINARITLEYEMMFTQRLVLIPEFTMNLYTQDDDAGEIGSGLSDMSLGLRLGYEIRREFAPYIGIHWSKKFGGTADHAREAGEKVSDTQFLMGIRMWF